VFLYILLLPTHSMIPWDVFFLQHRKLLSLCLFLRCHHVVNRSLDFLLLKPVVISTLGHRIPAKTWNQTISSVSYI